MPKILDDIEMRGNVMACNAILLILCNGRNSMMVDLGKVLEGATVLHNMALP